MSSRVVLLVLFLSFLADSSAQINSICSCSPSTFEFTFDFSLLCPDDLLLQSGGIRKSTCNVTPKSDRNITDTIPVAVTNIQILELDREAIILNQTDILGEFYSGDSFSYQSLTANGVLTEADIPGYMQVSVTALNVDGKDILMFWLAQYTNNCSFYPVFPLNGTTAWTFLSDATPPRSELCPSAPQSPSSISPTSISEPPATIAPLAPITPVTTPPFAPVTPVTTAPFAPATLVPIAPATLVPIAPATLVPIAPATLVPIAPATLVPIAPATLVPIAPATLAPIAPATLAPFAPANPVTPAPYSSVTPATPAPVTIPTVTDVPISPISPAPVSTPTITDVPISPLSPAPVSTPTITDVPISPLSAAPVTTPTVTDVPTSPISPAPIVAPETAVPSTTPVTPGSPPPIIVTEIPSSGPLAPITSAPASTDSPVPPVAPGTLAPVDTLEPTIEMSMSMDYIGIIDIENVEFGRTSGSKGKPKGDKAQGKSTDKKPKAPPPHTNPIKVKTSKGEKKSKGGKISRSEKKSKDDKPSKGGKKAKR